MNVISSTISGCSGPILTQDEKALFRETNPWGFILFKRNCSSPDQIRALIDSLRESVGRHAPVLIDEEGGRVQRLGPPHWPAYPKGAAYGMIYAADPALGLEAARLGARLIARDLHALGIDVDCLPVLDIPAQGSHAVIGERAYARDPDTVAALGRAAAEGLLAGGVLPVIKHIPGHGRTMVDSHHETPTVNASLDQLRAVDFKPFAALRDMPIAMTAHLVYAAVDADAPGTVSPRLIRKIIRDEIGFDGLLITDDINMKAVAGPLGDKVMAALDAGVDMVLHCSGDFVEMQEVARASRPLSGEAVRRADAALARLRAPDPLDAIAAKERFLELLMTRSRQLNVAS